MDPNGQHYVINSCSGQSKDVQPELFAMGEILLDSLETKQTELLTTKELAKLVKRDQLDDVFLMLINEDTSIQEVVSGEDPILAKVKGNCCS